MASHAPSSLLDRLRQRADALPLDRAPLRRAGLLTVLLIALLVLGRVFSPSAPPASDRQEVRSATEEVSAPRSSSSWTGGRVLAILFLVTGGGIAFWLHRRAGGRTVSQGSTLRVLETHTLGPGQSLRLVECGEEVLLLSVASEGATLLRHWPRETFEAEPVSFASALASLATDDEPLASSESPETSSTRPTASHLLSGDTREAPALRQPEIENDEPTVGVSQLAPPSLSPPQPNELRATSLGMDDAVERELSYTEELAEQTPAAPPEPAPVIARGTLFPPRTHAPHQFDVRHG